MLVRIVRRRCHPPGEGIWVHSKDDTERNQDAERYALHCARIKKEIATPACGLVRNDMRVTGGIATSLRSSQ